MKVFVLFVAMADQLSGQIPIAVYATLPAAHAAQTMMQARAATLPVLLPVLYAVREFDVLGMIEEGDDDAR